MAAWAYECRPADPSLDPWLVACQTVDAMPAGTRIVRVQVGQDWLCAVVDKRQRIEAQGSLLREVVASDEADCPECAARAEPRQPAVAPAREPAAAPSGRQVHAAAMSMLGHRFVVVLVGIDLVRSPGEADMAIADLRPRFGGVDVLLMGQEEDGTPVYQGKQALVDLLAETPVDRMPWKAYPIG